MLMSIFRENIQLFNGILFLKTIKTNTDYNLYSLIICINQIVFIIKNETLIIKPAHIIRLILIYK